MTDNQLIILLVQILTQGLIADGYSGVGVIQAYQSTQQGVNIAPAVYFSKSGDYWYGWQASDYEYNSTTGMYDVTETQRVESTFKIQALAIQSPLTPDAYTASDLVNEAGSILRSQTTVDAFRQQGVGLLRPLEVSNSYDLDDRDQFEASPAFNIVLVYNRTRTIQVPVIQSIDENVVQGI